MFTALRSTTTELDLVLFASDWLRFLYTVEVEWEPEEPRSSDCPGHPGSLYVTEPPKAIRLETEVPVLGGKPGEWRGIDQPLTSGDLHRYALELFRSRREAADSAWDFVADNRV